MTSTDAWIRIAIAMIVGLPYVYLVSAIIFQAYFNMKLDYQRRLFKNLSKGELE